jgi:alkanesulfonate monooxygenase SsuD/methylene tetrahydromethanopterin reductase-like flavin-dependent oxidoreductase (luciferase family)
VLFAVGVPNVREYADPSLLVSLAKEAELSGWDGCFVWDHLVYHEAGDPVADPWIVTAAIAQATERLRLGVLVAALARRRPWKVARETAALDLLSHGRVIVGAGLGSLAQEEFAAFAEDADARVRADKLDEALEIISGLWEGEEFSFKGRYFDVAPVVFRPRPIQRPRPPVWVGGRWPARRPFRRAARWDGVFATHSQVGHNQTMSAAHLEGIVRYTLSPSHERALRRRDRGTDRRSCRRLQAGPICGGGTHVVDREVGMVSGPVGADARADPDGTSEPLRGSVYHRLLARDGTHRGSRWPVSPRASSGA